MLGIEALQYACSQSQQKDWPQLILSGLAWTLFTVVTAGGFLWVVGIHPYATIVAFTPAVIFLLVLVFAYVGKMWACSQEDSNQTWFQAMHQGLQLWVFHTLWWIFVLSLGYLFLPWGALLVIGYIALLPMTIVPMVLSNTHRNFWGLMEASLEVFRVSPVKLCVLWAELFFYTLFWGGMVLPLGCVALTLSLVGIPLIPVAGMIFVRGAAYLVQSTLEGVALANNQAEKMVVQPIYSQSWSQNRPQGFQSFKAFYPDEDGH